MVALSTGKATEESSQLKLCPEKFTTEMHFLSGARVSRLPEEEARGKSPTPKSHVITEIEVLNSPQKHTPMAAEGKYRNISTAVGNLTQLHRLLSPKIEYVIVDVQMAFTDPRNYKHYGSSNT